MTNDDATRTRSNAERLRRYFRTPKGVLILVLLALAALASAGAGIGLVAPGFAAACALAMAVDAILLRVRKHRWVFPDGAMLTALIVAMILTPQEPWYVTAVTACIAVLSKYVLRWGPANIFNPAALGLVATFYLFDTGQSWWGALPDLPVLAILALFLAGGFITATVNKIPAVLSFLGTYYLLVTIAAFLGSPDRVAELYRAPDLHAALFFAFFMVTDPPTSPPRHRDQVVFGMITGVASVAAFELMDAAFYLLVGLLVANAWEAARRAGMRVRRVVGATAELEASSGS